MSRGINKVILVGNLGDDPDTKYAQSGTAVTKCSLATTSVRKDRDGNPQESTQWHRVVFFGKLAEIAGEYLRKGSQVYIEGELRYGSYEKDGVKHYTTDIVANEMQMVGGKPQDGGTQRQASRQERAPSRQAPRREAQPSARDTRNDFADDFDDDDLPL